MNKNVVINLDKESLLLLCGKDPEFEIAIQRAALNYLRNNKLKPLMKQEIINEIEGFKKDIRSNTKSVLKTLGITLESWRYGEGVTLNENVKSRIMEQVTLNISLLIEQTVNKEMERVKDIVSEKIKIWENSINELSERVITESTIKNIMKDIINDKFK